MTPTLENRVEAVLKVPVTSVATLDGGMIGSVHRVELADGRTVVAKTGDTPLTVEAFMLRHLGNESYLPVPDVYHADDDLLLLEFVRGTTEHSPAVARDAADRLASLHRVTGPAFGFERDTLTGPVRQPNPWTDSWVEFFGTHRLAHLRRVASETLSTRTIQRLESVQADLDHLLEEPPAPSLIHGDVWRTNVLSDDETVRAFLDPATYYAHPEVELAYVDWTDTFGSAFFERYRKRRGIEDGFYETRRFVYRLYPLLVHVHLFGGEYLDELAETLDRLGYYGQNR